MPDQSLPPSQVFISYSSRDKKYKDDILTHLKILQKQSIISMWHDGLLIPGQHWSEEVIRHLNSSSIILLLISPDFLTSAYVNDVELKLAAERHEAGNACVIPILVRNVNNWENQPFGNSTLGELHVLPANKKFIAERKHQDRVHAEVAEGIQKAAEDLSACKPPPLPVADFVECLLPVVEFVERRDRWGRDIVERLKKELGLEGQPEILRGRLVALWGPGGVGKTTLAAVLVKSLSSRWFWLNATSCTGFSLSTVLDNITSELGYEDLRTYDLERKKIKIGELVDQKLTLLVLNNFEEINPDEQKACEKWLDDSVSCPVLIVTRERVEAARNIAVETMKLTEARKLLKRLIDLEEHDKSAFRGVKRDDIIKAAECNPELIQWVVRQIARAQEPEDVLKDLAGGKGDALERIFDRSYNLPQVGDDGRSVLLAFSPFAAKASRSALAAVAGFGDDLDRLKRAVEKLSDLWLIEREEGILLVKGLARERIKTLLDESGRKDEFEKRYVDYFREYALKHKEHSQENFDALENENENGARAIDIAFSRKYWTDVVVIVWAIRSFLDRRRYWSDLIRLGQKAYIALQKALEETSTTDDSMLSKIIERIPKIIGIEHQNPEEAREVYEEALRYFEPKWQAAPVGSKERKKYACQMGIASFQKAVLWHSDVNKQRDLNEAQAWYEVSQRFKEECPNWRGIAAIKNNLGAIAEEEENFEKAAGLFRESIDLFTNPSPPSPFVIIPQRNLKRVNKILLQPGLVTKRKKGRKKAPRIIREATRFFRKLKWPDES